MVGFYRSSCSGYFKIISFLILVYDSPIYLRITFTAFTTALILTNGAIFNVSGFLVLRAHYHSADVLLPTYNQTRGK
jgi:hypothetical protein